MGCDIHLYVEKRADDKSPWVTADEWTYDKEDDYWSTASSFYSGRSYWLFSILADVRNGRGFAGVKTGEGFNPICEPRGIPENACPEYLRIVQQWGADGHSHSHHTVAELLAYDWTQETQHQGYVSLENYFRWKQLGKPSDWCSFIGGASITHTTPDVIDGVVERLGIKPWEAFHNTEGARDKVAAALGVSTHYTLVTWREPYYMSAAPFLAETLPRLWRLGAPENVRIIFFFDN